MGNVSKGGKRKLGRNKDKCNRYRLEGRREKNKLRRVFRNNGHEAAEAYAAAHGLDLKRVLAKK